MKIRLGALRRVIREALLTEAAKDVVAAGELALFVDTQNGVRTYLLYDPVELAKQLSGTRAAEPVYGVVMVNMFSDHPQWGAKEIEFSAAQGGYGPMMYDIAMADVGGLTPDRESVSRDAKGIWNFYKNSRPDVEKKQIDDWQKPLTATPDDDGERHSKKPGNPLDYAYFLKSGPDVSTLKANHSRALPNLEVSKKSGRALDFFAMAQMFADQHYNG